MVGILFTYYILALTKFYFNQSNLSFTFVIFIKFILFYNRLSIYFKIIFIYLLDVRAIGLSIIVNVKIILVKTSNSFTYFIISKDFI